MLLTLALTLPLAVAAAPPNLAVPHPFSVHDMVAMERLSDPQVSPDGALALFTVRATDLAANRGRTDLFVVGTDGSNLRRLTTHEANESNARWAPDGRSVLFLSTRSGSSQVWRLPLSGGEPEQVTRLPVDVDSFDVFPDGKRLLLAMEVYLDVPREPALAATAARDEERAKSKVSARAYDQLLYRHWDTWEDGKRSHLFVFTLGSSSPPVDLMPGFDGDAPTKPFGGPEEYGISPDGAEVAFSAQLMSREAAWSTDLNVYVVPASGKAAPRALTAANKAADAGPTYSPDGSLLAYLAMQRPGYEADRRRIVLLDRKTMKTRVLAEGWDRSPAEIVFSPDGKTLYATADDTGNQALVSIDVASGKVTPLVSRGTASSPRPARDWVLFSLDTIQSPAELRRIPAAGGPVTEVTNLNAQRVKLARMGDYEQFRFPGAKDETVHGYLIKPVGFKAGQKYPVALLIHGGPQGSFGDHFHYRWNPQAYAGAGYATLMIDFHGSTGYGQAFTDSIQKDWGGAPYEDLIKGMDFALGKYPFLDPARTGALGASYGGYMANWIAGHTDRFRALVSHDGIFDTRSAYYETEELWFTEAEHGGTPWENPQAYARFNPAEWVSRWKTPMLVIHGALDYRLPDTQGMAAFTALQRRGVPSRFLHFPDENHWVLKPQNSIRWHEEVLAWLDQWVKPAARRAPLARGESGAATSTRPGP